MLQRLLRRRGFRFLKRGGRLDALEFRSTRQSVHQLIEARAASANAEGPKPLWSGYRDVPNYPRSTTGTRTPDQVRSAPEMGRFFTRLARFVGNPVIVEIGTAFGVSGMYWLAGIGRGHLYAFEPNTVWAETARRNLEAISPNFTLTEAPFDGSAPPADIAFIDAIHTGDFVREQYRLLKMKPDSFVLFDDIDFSPDMRECWREIAADPDLAAAAEIEGHVGIIELRRSLP